MTHFYSNLKLYQIIIACIKRFNKDNSTKKNIQTLLIIQNFYKFIKLLHNFSVEISINIYVDFDDLKYVQSIIRK
jgi:hypothetical protein